MMFTRTALAASAFLLAATVTGASAADLYGGGYGGGSVKDGGYVSEPAYAPVASGPAGWYMRLDGGYAANSVDNFWVEGYGHSDDIDIDNGWSIGGGLGKYIGGGFRGDVTLDYRFGTDVEGYTLGCGLGCTGAFEVKSLVGLANLYYDFNRGGRFVPYIGLGLGFAHHKTDTGSWDCGCGVGSIESGKKTNFAFAGMAGFAWKIRGGQPTYVAGGMKDEVVEVGGGRNLWLDVGYRFMHLGDIKTGDIIEPAGPRDPEVYEYMSHEVRVGLRYDLN